MGHFPLRGVAVHSSLALAGLLAAVLAPSASAQTLEYTFTGAASGTFYAVTGTPPMFGSPVAFFQIPFSYSLAADIPAVSASLGSPSVTATPTLVLGGFGTFTGVGQATLTDFKGNNYLNVDQGSFGNPAGFSFEADAPEFRTYDLRTPFGPVTDVRPFLHSGSFSAPDAAIFFYSFQVTGFTATPVPENSPAFSLGLLLIGGAGGLACAARRKTGPRRAWASASTPS